MNFRGHFELALPCFWTLDMALASFAKKSTMHHFLQCCNLSTTVLDDMVLHLKKSNKRWRYYNLHTVNMLRLLFHNVKQSTRDIMIISA